MLIRDIFATTIQERIEPVVKVLERNPAVLLHELSNLVVTPQWEHHLRTVLDAYTDAAERTDEQRIGIWISGFFGSGKSLLMKVLGLLLEGGELQAQAVHDLFLTRLPETSPDKATVQRHLMILRRKLTTTVVGGNLHALLAQGDDSLALITFKLFALQRGYTHNWPFAWAVEYQLDERGLSSDFRHLVSQKSGMEWSEVAADPEFYLETLYAAAAEILPDHFSSVDAVERSANAILTSGITPTALVDRFRRWCQARDGGGRRHKLLIQLDELGQWIAAGNANERTNQVQALAETAAQSGAGRIWIAVTAHGDVQALKQNVQQSIYAKINQRFGQQCKLSNDDISLVVEERLLRKTQAARRMLEQRFTERSGELSDMGTVQAQRVYPAPDASRFALFYPYLPWTVAVIPDVVKGIAQAAGRDEALTGSNRTMIGVVQGAILETPGLLESPVGRLLSLADLYDQLASDVPIETKTDLNQVRSSVPEATDFTPRVARALFLLGEAEYIPTTLDNVVRSLIDATDRTLAALRPQVKADLERLVVAGYAKQVGDTYTFLSTQQRSFQDRVRARQDELLAHSYELSQALKEYDSEDALRFDRVALHGREVALKLDIDGRVARNPQAPVTLRVYSPFQRALDAQIDDDAALKQQSAQEPEVIIFRMADVPALRRTLALALATDEVATQVTSSPQSSDPDKDVARQARQSDLVSHKGDVRRLLGQAVRGGTVFFRGTQYQLAAADSAGAAVRATLAEILPSIYARFAEVPHRLVNEATAVKAALAGNTSNSDLQALGVYRADGTLNDAHPLVSTLRSRLPVDDQFQQFVPADTLRNEIQRPPFGWDPNVVRVGLALLLRASACRLIDNSRTLTDPGDPDVLLALTKEQKFKQVRVQGMRSDLTMHELQQIRGYTEALFGIKPALVAATLNTALGDQLATTTQQVQTIRQWASTAQCPLPQTFEAGSSLVEELQHMAVPHARLTRFREQAETLLGYMETLHELAAFQQQHGATFSSVRDFFNRMVNVEADIPAVRQFIQDWRSVTRERSITEAARWNELIQAYHAAQQAVTSQIATWQQDARQRLSELDTELEQQVRTAGVPEEQVASEAATLAALFQEVRERLEQTNPGLYEARGLLATLTNAELSLHQRLAEVRARYAPEPEPVPAPTGQETRLQWSSLAGQRHIRSAEELEQVLDEVRARVLAELERQETVILE
jgi:hypothetical protein